MTTTAKPNSFTERYAARAVRDAERAALVSSDNLSAHSEVARRVRSALTDLLGPAFGPGTSELPKAVAIQRDVANHALARVEADEAEMEADLNECLTILEAAKARLAQVTRRTYADYPGSKGGRHD